jgi:maleate isomerase
MCGSIGHQTPLRRRILRLRAGTPIVGFSCANALHIAHVPNWAKEKAILELLATVENELDAVVQCGTNMSLIDVTEKLEPVIGIPILGVNAVTFWFALRENGFEGAVVGAGRLLQEF